ncbi:MAG: hypothetical protein WDW38_001817 [Sanguina aurantia]
MRAERDMDEEMAAGETGTGAKKAEPKAKRVKGDTTDAAEDAFFSADTGGVKAAKFVEMLKLKNVSVGMRILGIILEVSSKGLTVSLPQGMRGHVDPAQASDVLAQLLNPKTPKAVAAAAAAGPPPPLTHLFQVGQYVRCTVMQLAGVPDAAAAAAAGKGGKDGSKKGLQLSLLLKRNNAGLSADMLHVGLGLPAVVKSVEDHGYILGFGIKGVRGFLKRKEHERVFGEGAPLLTGALVEVAVTSVADRTNIVVTSDTTAVAAAMSTEWAGQSLSALQPGALVNARVRKVLNDGLMVSFLTFFHGTVDHFHLPPLPPKSASSNR